MEESWHSAWVSCYILICSMDALVPSRSGLDPPSLPQWATNCLYSLIHIILLLEMMYINFTLGNDVY
jgi:hypothetical protein